MKKITKKSLIVRLQQLFIDERTEFMSTYEKKNFYRDLAYVGTMLTFSSINPFDLDSVLYSLESSLKSYEN